MKKITLLFTFIALCAAERSFAQGNTLTVTVTNNSCTAACDGNASVSVTGGTGPYSYSWQPSGGNSASATGLCTGTYTVVAYDPAAFSYGSTTLTITCPNAIFEMEAPLSLSLFPNPAQTSVSLDLSSAITGDYTFSIVNIFGELIKAEELFINRNFHKTIDVADLPPGMYFIGLRNAGNFYSGKFLKQ